MHSIQDGGEGLSYMGMFENVTSVTTIVFYNFPLKLQNRLWGASILVSLKSNNNDTLSHSRYIFPWLEKTKLILCYLNSNDLPM